MSYGPTVRELASVSFGTAAIAGLLEVVSEEDAFAVLDLAWSAGLRYYDTAPHYGQGLAEHRIGAFLRTRSTQDWLLSTKVGRVLKPDMKVTGPLNKFVHPLPFKQEYDYSYDGIMRSVEDSYQRLGLARIDILYVHDLGQFTHGDHAEFYYRAFLSSGRLALESLKQQGVIGAYGLGVNEVDVCIDVLNECDLDLILLAGRYTLLDRSAENTLLPLCLRRGVGLVIGGVFNSGILATGAVAGAVYQYADAPEPILSAVSELENICTLNKVSLPAAALAFPARHPAVKSVLIGPGNLDYLQQDLELLSAVIPETLWSHVDRWQKVRNNHVE